MTKAPAVRVKHVVGKELRPSSPQQCGATRVVEQQRVVSRSNRTNMRTCMGKGSVVVVDALNGDDAVLGVRGSSPVLVVGSLKGTWQLMRNNWGPGSRRTVKYPAGERHAEREISSPKRLWTHRTRAR